jgi:hypothetical protein
MRAFIYNLLAFVLISWSIVPGFSQTATEKKTETDVKRVETNHEKGLVKIYSASHERNVDIDIEEALKAAIEANVENAMKLVEVAMQKLEITFEKTEINLTDLEIDVEPIHIKIPELESLKDLKIKLEDLNHLNDLDIEQDWDASDEENAESDVDNDHRVLRKGKSISFDKQELKENGQQDKPVNQHKSVKDKDKAKGLKKIN